MSPSAATTMDTDEVSARDRIPFWNDWINQLFQGLKSDLYGDTEFDGRIASARAGDVILTRLESNRHRVMRSRTQVSTSLRSSDEISSIGRLVPFTFKPPAAFCCSAHSR